MGKKKKSKQKYVSSASLPSQDGKLSRVTTNFSKKEKKKKKAREKKNKKMWVVLLVIIRCV